MLFILQIQIKYSIRNINKINVKFNKNNKILIDFTFIKKNSLIRN